MFGIQLLSKIRRRFRQRLHFRLDICFVLTFDGFIQSRSGTLDCRLLVVGNFIARFDNRLARSVHQAIGLVAQVHHLGKLFILRRVSFCVTHHLVDLVLRQPAGGLDDNRLLFAGGFVLGGHVQDTIGIQIEAHLDLWHTTWRRWDIGEVETTE